MASKRGWQTFVYQTDVEPQRFRGAFFDEKEASAWVGKQKEGTYEVSTERPSDRKERLGQGAAREEAADE